MGIRQKPLVNREFGPENRKRLINRGASFHPRRAASAAICPARAVTKVFSPVIADISENSPVSAAERGEAIRAAVV